MMGYSHQEVPSLIYPWTRRQRRHFVEVRVQYRAATDPMHGTERPSSACDSPLLGLS